MKIIDAHLHLFSNESPRPEQMAQAVGHHNSTDHLREVYAQLGMVHGVVMGNTSLELDYHRYPEDLFHYCIGLDSSLLPAGTPPHRMAELVEAHLQRESCCGIKLYPGYNKTALTDPMYEPIYALAAQYHKPVAVHMGLTSHARAHLKYCHPLALDEVAADHPPHPLRHVPLRQPLPGLRRRRGGEEQKCGHRPVRSAGGPGQPGAVFSGAVRLCGSAEDLAGSHWQVE